MSMIDECLSIYMKIHWVFKLLISLNFLFCYFSHTNTHTFKNKNNTSSHSQDYLEFYQRKHHLKYGAVDNYVGVITVEQSMDQVKSVENDEEWKLVIVNCVVCACPKIIFRLMHDNVVGPISIYKHGSTFETSSE